MKINGARKKEIFYKNMLFGSEDSLVSSVGVLFGLASSQSYSKSQIILTGVIVIAVEAISMGIGSYLTEKEVGEIAKKKIKKSLPLFGGLVMFLSYCLSGLLVISPYLLLPTPQIARFISAGLTLLLLYLVGYLPSHNIKTGIRTLTLAGLAILTGFLIGKVFKV